MFLTTPSQGFEERSDAVVIEIPNTLTVAVHAIILIVMYFKNGRSYIFLKTTVEL